MKTRIGHLLVRDDLVTDAQLSRALETQNFAGGRIGTLLLERGVLGEDELGRTLAIQHGCGYIPWESLCNIPAETILTLPARFGLKHSAIPFENGEGYVKMALRDPSDLRILDELVFVTGRRVLVSVAPEVRIYQALEKYYGKLRTPRFAILSEKLDRELKRSRPRATAPPPPPDFFAERPASAVPEPSPPGVTSAPEKVEPLPAPGPPAWAAFFGEPEPGGAEGIAWEDSTGGRSRPRPELFEAPPPAPVGEGLAFDFGFDSAALAAGEIDFSVVRDATERDEIARAILEAMTKRFYRAAIFSSRSDGVAGWAAIGDGTDSSALRQVEMTWTEPSVFLNTRLTRSFHLGSLPDLPGHDRLSAALGGNPKECVVEPVFIGEKPVAFLLAADPRKGSVGAEDLGYLHELARVASASFENAIRLKKKEI